MKNDNQSRGLSILFIAGTALGLSSAQAARPNADQVSQVQEMTLPQEKLAAFGITGPFMNSSGDVREIRPGELLKVRFHEEMGILDFSSFDGYSRSIYEMASTPRNLI